MACTAATTTTSTLIGGIIKPYIFIQYTSTLFIHAACTNYIEVHRLANASCSRERCRARGVLHSTCARRTLLAGIVTVNVAHGC